MFALTESQIDSLQSFAAGLLSVTDIALRLKADDIHIVALTDNLDADMLYLLQSGEKEAVHVPCVGKGSGQYVMQLNRSTPAGDDFEALVVTVSYLPSTIRA
jgi:hypothetical protein